MDADDFIYPLPVLLDCGTGVGVTAAGKHISGSVIGPSGTLMPPHGNGDFDDVYSFYRKQVRAPEQKKTDFLLAGSQTTLSDMRALVLAARTNDLPIVVIMTVHEDGMTSAGTAFLPALLTLQEMGADAVGIEFSCAPERMLPLVENAALHNSVPLAACASDTAGLSPAEWAAAMRHLMDAGVSIAGGKRLPPACLKQLHASFSGYVPLIIPEEPDCFAATIDSEAFFLGDDLMFSHPLRCSAHLEDELIELDGEQASVTLVCINDLADADFLAAAAHLTRQPIAVRANSVPVLEAALRYFQGRLIIDSNCELEPEVLEPLAKKYGAILY